MDNPLEKHLIVSFYSKRRRTGPGHLIKPHKPILRELPIIDPAPRTPLRDLANALCDFKFLGFDSENIAVHSCTKFEVELVALEMKLTVHPADASRKYLHQITINNGEKEFWKEEKLENSMLPAISSLEGPTFTTPIEFHVRNGHLRYKDPLGEGFVMYSNLASPPLVVGLNLEEFRRYEILKAYYNFESAAYCSLPSILKLSGTLLRVLVPVLQKCAVPYIKLRLACFADSRENFPATRLTEFFDWEYLESSIDAVQTTFRDSIEMFWPELIAICKDLSFDPKIPSEAQLNETLDMLGSCVKQMGILKSKAAELKVIDRLAPLKEVLPDLQGAILRFNSRFMSLLGTIAQHPSFAEPATQDSPPFEPKSQSMRSFFEQNIARFSQLLEEAREQEWQAKQKKYSWRTNGRVASLILEMLPSKIKEIAPGTGARVVKTAGNRLLAACKEELPVKSHYTFTCTSNQDGWQLGLTPGSSYTPGVLERVKPNYKEEIMKGMRNFVYDRRLNLLVLFTAEKDKSAILVVCLSTWKLTADFALSTVQKISLPEWQSHDYAFYSGISQTFEEVWITYKYRLTVGGVQLDIARFQKSRTTDQEKLSLISLSRAQPLISSCLVSNGIADDSSGSSFTQYLSKQKLLYLAGESSYSDRLGGYRRCSFCVCLKWNGENVETHLAMEAPTNDYSMWKVFFEVGRKDYLMIQGPKTQLTLYFLSPQTEKSTPIPLHLPHFKKLIEESRPKGYEDKYSPKLHWDAKRQQFLCIKVRNTPVTLFSNPTTVKVLSFGFHY